ncbi:ankyrin repeat domain-containing protein [Sphingobacterium suaedae]|uniref:Ankyrin repeat domain-containing protein n=1 Tax=Sphingobacterium suaedae TaxID=1686402 RepID=A0ABW5KK92_9SPHI
MHHLLLLCSILFFPSCDAFSSADKNSDTVSSLLEAVQQGRLSIVEQALKNGANVHEINAQGQSLLLIATRNNNIRMANLLLLHGADVNQQDHIQDSPFLYAGAAGYVELVQLYLKSHARFDIYNRYGGSALIPACERGHVAVVKLLAHTKGYPIDHVNRLGWTALLEAIILGDGSAKYIDIVQILLDTGCNPDIADKYGVSPLQHAKNRGFDQIVQLLAN